MIGAGLLMLLLGGWALLAMRRPQASRRLLALLPLAIALPYVGNSTGWIFTEIGRQPWIVFGLQKTADAVSPNVSAGAVLFSLLAFSLVYGALMVADVYLLAKFARRGAPPPGTADEHEAAPPPAGGLAADLRGAAALSEGA
jgi:cytochrome d ubiquinol oxidase subunit I